MRTVTAACGFIFVCGVFWPMARSAVAAPPVNTQGQQNYQTPYGPMYPAPRYTAPPRGVVAPGRGQSPAAGAMPYQFYLPGSSGYYGAFPNQQATPTPAASNVPAFRGIKRSIPGRSLGAAPLAAEKSDESLPTAQRSAGSARAAAGGGSPNATARAQRCPDLAAIAKEIEYWEGDKKQVYYDNNGNKTIGVGHLLTGSTGDRTFFAKTLGVDYDKVLQGKQLLTDTQIATLLEHDLANTMSWVSGHFAHFGRCPTYLQEALVSMVYRGEIKMAIPADKQFVNLMNDALGGFVCKPSWPPATPWAAAEEANLLRQAADAYLKTHSYAAALANHQNYLKAHPGAATHDEYDRMQWNRQQILQFASSLDP